MLCAVLTVTCGKDDAPTVSGLEFVDKSVVLAHGDMYQARLLECYGDKRANYDMAHNRLGVVWSVGDSRVATVDANGMVEACGYGRTSLTASSLTLDISAKAEVSVMMQSLRLDTSDCDMIVGEQVELRLLVTEQGRETEVSSEDAVATWSAEDESVVAVVGGVMTALKAGQTRVTVISPYYAKQLYATVTVYDIDTECVGEWMLASWNGDTAIAGRVYMELGSNGRFNLYQNIDGLGYESFGGYYTSSGGVLNGRYDDGVAWSQSYRLRIDGNELWLTGSEDGIVALYESTTIPEHVKDGITAAAVTRGGRRML